MNPPLNELSQDMFHELMEELRHVRSDVNGVRDKLDRHVETEDRRLSSIEKELAGYRGRWTAIVAGLSLFVTSGINWILNKGG